MWCQIGYVTGGTSNIRNRLGNPHDRRLYLKPPRRFVTLSIIALNEYPIKQDGRNRRNARRGNRLFNLSLSINLYSHGDQECVLSWKGEKANSSNCYLKSKQLLLFDFAPQCCSRCTRNQVTTSRRKVSTQRTSLETFFCRLLLTI